MNRIQALQIVEGALLSIFFAELFARVLSHSLLEAAIPFVFAGVLILLSWRFGALVSVIGSIFALFIFAYTFRPVHMLKVDSEIARANLAWMVLLSVAGSYLLFPPEGRKPSLTRSSNSSTKNSCETKQ